jgi:hypothetical protein
MSEENTELQPTEVVPEASESTEAPKLSAIEQKALEMGWRPREEFDGDDETFIDAKEFVNRKPLFEKISSQSKQIKRLEQTTHALQQHYSKVHEHARKEALRELKAELETAVEEGDLTKYHALNQRREEIEEDFKAQQQSLTTPKEAEVPEELEQWIERNTWFKEHEHMRVFADRASDRFAAKVRAGLMTTGEALREVEKLVREEFPSKFRNPNKDKPSAVEGGAGKGGGRASGEIELTADEKRIMNTVLNTKDRDGKPFITREKYLADLKKMRGQ